jgi:hypothetical protein
MDLEVTQESPLVAGHPEFDRREGTWYCRIREDLTDMDTMPLKQLPISAITKPAVPVTQPAGSDPYNRENPAKALDKAQRPRRTLDDMRKLSEEIKRMRAGVTQE